MSGMTTIDCLSDCPDWELKQPSDRRFSEKPNEFNRLELFNRPYLWRNES